MIKDETIFILGAGASEPYGFPLGEGIRKAVCVENNCTNLANVLHTHCGIQGELIKKFGRAFRSSALNSIDAFLARRPDQVDIGKKIIAALLCPIEMDVRVFNPINEDDWYRHLWNLMIVDADESEDLLLNRLKFITFNYDRSLEYFFFHSIQNSYMADRKEALDLVRRIPILHVYGSLGALHYDPTEAEKVTDNARVYDEKLDGRIIGAAAAGLRVIPESRTDSSEFKLARKWLEQAKYVVLLGYGFDALNTNRLGVAEIISRRNESSSGRVTVWASVYQSTQAEIIRYHRMLGSPKRWVPLEHKNLLALRNSGVLQ